jgi:hypothetical protein
MGVTPWCYDYLRVLVHWAGKARKKLGHNTGWHNVAAVTINFPKISAVKPPMASAVEALLDN